MNINKFNRRVTLTVKRRVANDRGGYSLTEIPLGTFWTYKVPLTTEKQIQYMQVDIKANAKFYFLEDYRIDESSVINDNGSRYEVIKITLPEEKGIFMEVLCSAEK